MASEKRKATYADIEALPEHLRGEIIDDELIVSPRPKPPHLVTASRALADLEPRFGRDRKPGGWWILAEPELHLGRQVLVPDLAGWRRERLAKPQAGVGFTVSPDWVCEVLSPSTQKIDRGKKRRAYARHEVAYLWIVDPILRFVEVFRRHGDGWLLVAEHQDDDVARVPPFEAIELALGEWWLDLEPRGAAEPEATYEPRLR